MFSVCNCHTLNEFEAQPVPFSGGYMQVKIADAMIGEVTTMTSPEFSRDGQYCLSFDYEVTASSDSPALEVHTRMTDYKLSGDMIWSSQWDTSKLNRTSITIQASENVQHMPQVLDFVGVLGEPKSTVIRLANIEFSNGQCDNGTGLCFIDDETWMVGITTTLNSYRLFILSLHICAIKI